jgi:hypothetical protein
VRHYSALHQVTGPGPQEAAQEAARVARTLPLPADLVERNARLVADLHSLSEAALPPLVSYMRTASHSAVAAFFNRRLPVSLGVPRGTVVPASLQIHASEVGAPSEDVSICLAAKQFFASRGDIAAHVAAHSAAPPRSGCGTPS